MSVRKGDDLFSESQIIESFLESSQDSIIIHDMAGNFLYVNPAAKNLFEYTDDEVFSANITDFLAAEDMDIAKEHREHRQEGYQGLHKSRVSLIKKGGKKIQVEIVSTQTQLKGGPIFILRIRDLSKEAMNKKRLEVLNSQLEILDDASNIQEIADFTVDLLTDLLLFDTVLFSVITNDSQVIISQSRPIADHDQVFPLDGDSVSVTAIREKRSQLILDTSENPAYYNLEYVDSYTALSELSVPVIVDGHVEALITVLNEYKDAFNLCDQALVEMLSKQVALVVQRLHQSRLFDGIRVYGKHLSEAIDIDDVANVAINYMTDFIGADFASFHLIEGDQLKIIEAFPFTPDKDSSLNSKGITRKAAQTRRPVLILDVRDNPDYLDGGVNTLSELAVPVLSSGNPLAVLNVESEKTQGFNKSDQIFLETLADEVALTLNRIKSYDLLQRSEEYYHNLVDNVNEGICVTTVDSVITFVNKKFAEYFNCISEEMIGRPIYDLVADDEVERIKKLKSRRMQGYINTYETFLKRLDGTVFPVIVQASPLFDHDKKFTGVIAGVLDISNRYIAEQRLKESEAQFRNLLVELPDPVFITDNKKYVFANKAAADLLEIENSNDLIGKNFLDFFAPSERERIGENAEKRLKGESIPSRYDTLLYSRSGEQIPVDIRIRVINYEGQDAILSIFRDMRERIRYEKRLKALFDHTYQLDKVDSVSEIFRITHQAMQTALSGEIFDIIKVEDGQLIDVISRTSENYSMNITDKGVTTRAARRKQTQIVNDVTKDPEYVQPLEGVDIKSEIVVPVLVHGEAFCLINVESMELNSFTPQDQEILETFAINVGNAVEKLLRFEALEEQVRERTKELKISNEQLMELDQMKDSFISQAAHELRTPLTSIKGYLEIMEPKIGECPPEFSNYYDIVHRNTMRLSSLTDDLLNQQRIASGRFYVHKEESDIYEIIEAAITDVSPVLMNKGINVERNFEENIPRIVVDPIRVTQVIVNLLDNAAKFSPDKSTITLKLEKIDDHIKISCRDEGLGIRPEDLPKLFKPFPGIEKPNSFIGTGLGLSICKGIVELHNGTIMASSDGINKGSCFCFTLPLS